MRDVALVLSTRDFGDLPFPHEGVFDRIVANAKI